MSHVWQNRANNTKKSIKELDQFIKEQIYALSILRSILGGQRFGCHCSSRLIILYNVIGHNTRHNQEDI